MGTTMESVYAIQTWIFFTPTQTEIQTINAFLIADKNISMMTDRIICPNCDDMIENLHVTVTVIEYREARVRRASGDSDWWASIEDSYDNAIDTVNFTCTSCEETIYPNSYEWA